MGGYEKKCFGQRLGDLFLECAKTEIAKTKVKNVFVFVQPIGLALHIKKIQTAIQILARGGHKWPAGKAVKENDAFLFTLNNP